MALLACKSVAPLSNVKHDINTAVESDLKYSWTTQNLDELLEDLAISKDTLNQTLFADTSPMAKRLQYWVDKIDSDLRQRGPAEHFVHVPKPKVRLIKNAESNAFVKPALIYFENVRFSAGPIDVKDFTPTDEAVAFENGMYVKEKVKAHKVRSTIADVIKLSKSLTNKYPECDLDVKPLKNDNYLVYPVGACSLSPLITSAPGQSWNLFAASTSSDFVVFTGLLAERTEDEVIWILAHELKHYYGAHAAVSGKDYLYHIKEENQPQKPSHAEDLAVINSDLEKTYRRLRRSQTLHEDIQRQIKPAIFPVIKGQLTHTYLGSTLLNYAYTYGNAFCSRRNEFGLQCAICSNASTYIKGSSHLNNLLFEGRGVIGPMTAEQQAWYLKFEKATLDCLNYIAIDSVANNTTADQPLDKAPAETLVQYLTGQMSYGLPKMQAPKPEGKLGDYLVAFSTAMQDDHTYDYTETGYAQYKALIEQDDAHQKEFSAARAELDTFAQTSSEQNLGFYSHEQEADEAAIEWMANIGLDVNASVSSAIAHIQSPEARQECLDLRARNWMDASGKPVILPWGWFAADPHPDNCYRARNNAMEIRAHGYPKVLASASAAMTPPWADLLKGVETQLTLMTKASLPTQNLRLAAALMQLKNAASCEYAKKKVLLPGS